MINIRSKWIKILSGTFIVSFTALITSWFLIRKASFSELYATQTLQTNTQLRDFQLSAGILSPIVGFGIEFMKDFTVFNSTLHQFVLLSGLNSSSANLINTYITDVKVFYNISHDERPEFEERLSLFFGNNRTILDLHPSGNFVPAAKRQWYCPSVYISPFNSDTVFVPGVDSCAIDVFRIVINNVMKNPLYDIGITSRDRQVVFNDTVIEFSTMTPNGFLLVSMLPHKIFLPLKNLNIDSIVYLNDIPVYTTCSPKCNSAKLSHTRQIDLPFNDRLSFSLIFNDENVNMNSFFYILASLLLFLFIETCAAIVISNGENKYIIANQMLAYVNHEIRNPLNSIAGLLDITLDDLNEINNTILSEIISNLHTARNATDLLKHIVNDVLDYHKLSNGKMEIVEANVDVFLMKKRILNIIRPKLSEKPQISYEFMDNGITEIFVDENRIIQILVNLVTNSIKFTSSGFITVVMDKVGSNLCFSVTDTGRGIDPVDYDKIFQPFVQSGVVDVTRHLGIGLGLNLCKTFVTLMGGNIGFDSELGKHTTFHFTIPIKENQF